jgi:hypothetical protein
MAEDHIQALITTKRPEQESREVTNNNLLKKEECYNKV